MMALNKELLDRPVNTRETKEVYNVYSIEEIEKNFQETLTDIDDNLGYIASLKDGDAQRKEEFWRYQIVLLESAFDYFCHCIMKLGAVKMFRHEWRQTTNYLNFNVKLKQLNEAIGNGIDETWILKMIDEKIASQTYLGCDDINKPFNFLSEELFSKICISIHGKDKTTSISKAKADLNFVYTRRNQITHQNDRDHQSGEKYGISRDHVVKCKSIIEKFVRTAITEIRRIPNEPEK